MLRSLLKQVPVLAGRYFSIRVFISLHTLAKPLPPCCRWR